MSEPALEADAPAPCVAVRFERTDEGLFALAIGDLAVRLSEAEARVLGVMIEAELGSARLRTFRSGR